MYIFLKRTFQLAGLALFFCASSAMANLLTYHYSYTFSGGRVVAGSFDGFENGNLITGLSNISASLDGVPFAGNGTLAAFSVATNGIVLGGATASWDGTQNNFMFIDGDFHQAWSNYVFFNHVYEENLNPIHTLAAEVVSIPTSQTAYDFQAYSPTRWTLVAEVPEPGTLALLALGLISIGLSRRRQ